MNKTQIHQALTTYLGSIGDHEMRWLVSRGGHLGLSWDTDPRDFDSSDFCLVLGQDQPRDVLDGIFAFRFSIDAQQEFFDGELLPLGEGEEEDDFTVDRITDLAVTNWRKSLVDTAEAWVDDLREWAEQEAAEMRDDRELGQDQE